MFLYLKVPIIMLNEALSKMPEVFDAKVLLRGQEYFLQGMVLNVRLSEGLLRGRVKGSSSHLYDVHMDLRAWPGKSSHCSCAYQHNCKHAAACLFALRDKDDGAHPVANRLERKLDIWLKNLRAQEELVVKKQELSYQVVYLIRLKCEGHQHQVIIQLGLAKCLKKGGYGKKVIFNSLAPSKKQYFNEEDEAIIAQLLFKCDAGHWFDNLIIRNSELLIKILQTERVFWLKNEEQTIRLGEERVGSCAWQLTSDGLQHLVLLHANKRIVPLLLDDCWYVDDSAAVMGHLTTPYSIKQLSHLLDAPPVTLEQVEPFSKRMEQTYPGFPLPKKFIVHEQKEIEPTPVLILDALGAYTQEWARRYEYEDTDLDAVFIAKLVFDYAGTRVDFHHQQQGDIVQQHDGQLLKYSRAPIFEKKKYEEAEALLALRQITTLELTWWPADKREYFALDKVHKLSDLDTLYSNSLPYLQEKGWRIEFASAVYQQVLDADELEWYSDLQGNTTDFFSYQLGILIEGKPVSIVPVVAELIQHYRADALDTIPDTQLLTLPLDKGRALQVAMGRIKPLVRLLLQLGIKAIGETQQLHISKYQLILMQEIELALIATKARWYGEAQLRQQLKQIITQGDLPVIEPPIGLTAVLRDYQLQGLQWLQRLRASAFNGILADDMGLGKTVQTLAHLQYEKEHGRLDSPALIIAPTSLVMNWQLEAQRFTPTLKTLVYHGNDRHEDQFDEYDLVISTYGLTHRDKERFTAYSFYYLILDEAQFIKNARTKTTQIIQQLKATHRLCLTGTPLENHLGELWSLFHFLMPGLLGEQRQFRSWFQNPIEREGDKERQALLTQRVKPFMLRRTKNQVARELPPKTEILQRIELVGPQRDLYEAIRMTMEKKVREAIAKQGLGKSHIVLLDALLKLRQVCCDPRLLSIPDASMAHGVSAKLEMLLELLDSLVEEGRRVLIFSQFTSMLRLIEEQLVVKGYPYLKLTGQTQNRQILVDTFQAGETPIFLISLKAGGTGLNLTRADTVIHYDPWWNPAVEDQATDRSHRIGQENPVFVYKLITSGTVEEAILTMQERKRQLVGGVLSTDANSTMSLTEADLAQFFMPLGES